MTPTSERPTTFVLHIDGSQEQHAYWADQLRGCSPDYEIVGAMDGQSGLDLFRSRRVDCVILELDLPDRSGFEILLTLVPLASRPQIAVIVLTQMTHPGIWELAKQNGAYACLVKRLISGEDLDKAIQQGMAFVGEGHKEDRSRPI